MKEKHCDLCGKKFTGMHYPVYNENYRKQSGFIQCESCAKNEEIQKANLIDVKK